MSLPRLAASAFPVGMIILGATTALAQNYPNKPIRILTNETGGSSDFVARLIAQGLVASLGQQVVVDNRPAGVIAPAIAAKAPPDGYTLHVTTGLLWMMSLFQGNLPFDPVKDFAPVSLTNKAPITLVVHPSVPANSVKELIALAKAKPGELNYASTATGSSGHLGAELFKSMAGVNMVRIPYKGAAPALTDLIGGRVQVMFANAVSVVPHIKSGKVRALAVTSLQPSELAPGLPTVASSGLPGYEAGSVHAVFAPARTPAAIVSKLNQEIVKFINQPDIKAKFLSSGNEIVGSSPQQLAAAVKSDLAIIGKLMKDAGIQAE